MTFSSITWVLLEKTPCAEREAERMTGAITSIALLIERISRKIQSFCALHNSKCPVGVSRDLNKFCAIIAQTGRYAGGFRTNPTGNTILEKPIDNLKILQDEERTGAVCRSKNPHLQAHLSPFLQSIAFP